MAHPETNTGTWKGGFNEGVSEAHEAVEDLANKAKDKTAQFGRAAAQTIEDGKHVAGDAIDSAASSIKNAAEATGDAVTGFAKKAADAFGLFGPICAPARPEDDGERRHRRGETEPRSGCLLAAVAVGFLAGAALRRSR